MLIRRLLKRQKYKHLNKILISQSAIRKNYEMIQKFHPEAQIAPVLKSNAYGHGLRTVAPVFDSLGAPFLVVDSLYEAYELRKCSARTPILIMGYTIPDNLKIKRLPFTFNVFDLETAGILDKYQPGCRVHVMVDTGMTREGVVLEEFEDFIKAIKFYKNIKIDGLCSHFADADNPKSLKNSNEQLEKFKQAYEIMQKHGIHPSWRHISASAGTFKYHDPILNLLRVGKALYGVSPLAATDPFAKEINLIPAMQFVSTIAQIKHIKKGTQVGYSFTYTAPKEMTVALLGAGYYEGIDRRLSNTGVVHVDGIYCPIIGRVSMNMTVVDVSRVKDPLVGQEVIVYSNRNTDKNSLYNAALIARTIPYDIVSHISHTVRRELTG